MANKARGEIGVEVGGKHYTLRPTFDSLCELEDLLDLELDQLLIAINHGRLSSIRTVVWALLQDEHAEEFKALRDAGKFIERVGVDKMVGLLGELFGINFPAQEAGTSTANPPKARRAGTGTRSGKTRAASA